MARQVRVFESYLQYVELRLPGVAIQRRRIAIPRNIQNLGSDESIQSRLNTTFELIEREGALSSKPIEREGQLYTLPWQGSRACLAQDEETAV